MFPISAFLPLCRGSGILTGNNLCPHARAGQEASGLVFFPQRQFFSWPLGKDLYLVLLKIISVGESAWHITRVP